MTCVDYQEWISAAMDGMLEREHQPALDRHLAACAECRAARDDYQVQRMLLRSLTVPDAEPHPIPAAPRRRSWLRRGLQVAAAFTAALLGSILWLGLTEEVPLPAERPAAVEVAPESLLSGHSLSVGANPAADHATWHFLVSDQDDESPQPGPAGR